MIIYLVLSLSQKLHIVIHNESWNHCFKLFLHILLYCILPLLEDRHIDEFVLFSVLEMNTILFAEFGLHLLISSVNDNVLEAPHKLVKLIVFFITSRVGKLKLFFIAIVRTE